MSYITNRQVRQHYETLKKIEAGISLNGSEVKSIKTGKGSLIGAKVLIRAEEAFLVGANIPTHQEKNSPKNYDPLKTRKLLLNKKEIRKLLTETEAKNLIVLPISMYGKAGKIKVEIGVLKKKNARDKREDVKKRDSDRQIKRSLK